MKFTLKTVIIAIAVVIVIVLYGGLYTLEEGLQAIVVQFGRPVGEPVTEAGLHMKLPFVQEVQGKADAEATQIYGQAFNKNPEFYAFLRTLESYKEKTNMNSILILTTDSDFYQYIKQASPGKRRGR